MSKSYGVIAFVNTKKGPKYLLVQRKDSLAIKQLILNYHKLSESAIKTCIDKITIDECYRILKCDFITIWKDLFSSQESIKIFNTRKDFSEKNFIKLIDENKLQLENRLSKRSTTLEWGFPKGRKFTNEKNFDCAIREWNEETTLAIKFLHIVNTDPFTYKLVYGTKSIDVLCWLARMDKEVNIEKKDTGIREYISAEIGEAKWVLIKEAKSILSESIYSTLLEVDEFVKNNLL